MQINKKLFTILTVSFLSFVLAGCSILGYTLPFGKRKESTEKKQKTEVTLVYWSLFEDYQVLSPLFEEYQKENPHIKIVFEQKDFDSLNSYKDSLLSKLVQGEEKPDIIRIHQTWVPSFVSYLSPAPSNLISVLDFQKDFYPSAQKSVIYSDKIYGMPLMFDSLALFYNKEIFDFAKVSPPSTWSDFADLAVTLTKSSGKDIQVAGAAFGNASNVAHFSDIISLMMLQSGLELPEDFTSPAMQDIIKFYTSFVKDTPVWSSDMAYSPLAFAQGKVAMMFGTSWRLLEILRENPSLSVGVVPVPQAVSNNSLTNNNVTSFWVEGVNKSSKNSEEAWKLLVWLSQKEQLVKAFTNSSTIRPFGEPYPRISLKQELSTNPYLPSFFVNAENAEPSVFTDASGNDQYVQILRNVIEGYLGGVNLEELLKTAQQEY
ncbi:MAG TPA: sugar ABC transporter substrate-binding protein, partial [candidate division WWE3 bacterium]|nr:sugar ABC transporter substrate-binding protein [candidate division WWE3 bacterium]